MRNRRGAFLALSVALACAVPGARAAEAGEDVSVTVTGLRNARGKVMACLTALPRAFPDCRKDPAARTLGVAAAKGTVTLDFGPVPAGIYAISLFHDENGNDKLDKAVLIPKEGFGFSRDAKVVMGPPRFSAAAFAVAGAPVRQVLRMRYML